ncbi:MAG: nickel pincer cofactor biosynthesis protein LarB [Anaerococcus sp.]
MDAREILEKVKNGDISIENAINELKIEPFKDIDYAKVDFHRKIRNGVGEVIYGAGKTSEQIIGIMKTMIENDQKSILITRLNKESAIKIKGEIDFEYHEDAKIGIYGDLPKSSGLGKIVIATGGTSDIPVAEEAALTAEFLGNEVVRLYDVGVAGLHRLLAHIDILADASVVIAIAGMEGALASVIGGLVDAPVIAVPTSIGYGAAFNGVAALLSMLNSCASGVSVVNIDNGFGAGYMANMINHMEAK